MSNRDWKDKAKRIIAELCEESYLKANTAKSGRLYKRHRPYSVPEEAQFLIGCLDRDDEERAKDYFIQRAFRG